MSKPLASDRREGSAPLLEVVDLRVWFPFRSGPLRGRRGWIRAVDGVSFQISRGETLGLVGESGSGKSTVCRAVVRITPATSGSIRLAGEDITTLTGSRLRTKRRNLQMIFQDPYSSLNPRHKIADIVGEPFVVHNVVRGRERAVRVGELLERVGLDPGMARRYPHEFSGGQRQRIGIARAIALEPDVIVCDEPISALDVSIQAQVITLLEDLQRELGLTYLFIAHDLAMVRYLCTRVAVMYLGEIVELGVTEDVYLSPRHPYTAALMSAAPIPDVSVERTRRRIILNGDIPSPVNPPQGCHFHTRCWLFEKLGRPARCTSTPPSVTSVGPAGHVVACHYSSEMSTHLPVVQPADEKAV